VKKTYRRGNLLKVQVLEKLVEVFRELNWNIENEDRFNRFCKLLSRLKDEEQQLIKMQNDHSNYSNRRLVTNPYNRCV
jgi:hypothetical protein